MQGNRVSVVEYHRDSKGRRCGYCRSKRSYTSGGLWAHSIGVLEYQNLIDRGWRRSGCYVYKPAMDRTCCPMYTIRCEVGGISVTNSQKKVLKRFQNYLKYGDKVEDLKAVVGASGSFVQDTDGSTADSISSSMKDVSSLPSRIDLNKIMMAASPSTSKGGQRGQREADTKRTNEDNYGNQEELVDVNMPSTNADERGSHSSEVDATQLHQPRKAKIIRLENKYNRLISRGISEEEAVKLTYHSKKKIPEKKALNFEDYFPQAEDMHSYRHKFKVELCPSSKLEENLVVMQLTYNLYKKYQMAVHGDAPEDCSYDQFVRFLVSSPLFDTYPHKAPESGFGSFHQQYWLDGNLIAVGVIDILPFCVTAVYFFYDPELMSLSLGTFGCLHEILYAKSLSQVCPGIQYYYLGYYIHKCTKMNYKGKYKPSFLLCPETYTWHPIEKCLALLDKSKYSRLEEDPAVLDELGVVNMIKVMVLYKYRPMGYMMYKELDPNANDEEVVMDYAKQVGAKCYERLHLFRK